MMLESVSWTVRVFKEDIEVMDQKEPTFLTALCLTMCPHAEIQLRLKSNLGHKLEKRVINGVRTEFTDSQLMVKEFSRSSAGHIIKASDVRPVPVLVKTVKYLFDVVCSFEDVSWQEIYHFVSNRLRAVHQDVIVQGGSGEEVIHIFSSAARFYVYSHYRLCENNCNAFDPHLNLQQLREVFLTILPMIRMRLLASYNKMEGLTHEINNLSIGHSWQNDFFKEDRASTWTFNLQDSKLKSPFLDKEENKNESSSVEDDIKKNNSFIKLSLFEEIISLHLLMNISKPEVLFEILQLPKVVRTGALKNLIKAVISYFCGNHLPLVTPCILSTSNISSCIGSAVE
ncbi:UNVERIFIED_CONTAM: hypothetical protein RMT77_018178 [Armadillidium vulgare]